MASSEISKSADVPGAVYDRAIEPEGNDSLSRIARRIRNGSCVLDLGAASGALGVYLAAHKQCVVDGVEIDPDLARRAEGAYRTMRVFDLETSLLIDHFAPGSYDYIVCADVLEHLQDPGKVLDQLHQLLKPDGRLCLSVPNVAHAGVIAELIAGDFRYRPDGLLDETHLRFFTRRSLLDLLLRHRFAAMHVETVDKDIRETEFRDHYLDTSPESIFRAVLAQPDALTYQFIVEAMPGERHAVDAEHLRASNLRFGCQLFWRSEGEEFTAEKSCVASGIIGERRQTVSFRISAMASAPLALRLDPADRPGFLHLYAIRVHTSGGDVVWQWDGHLRSISAVTCEQIVFLYQTKALLLVGNDPHLVLPIPAERLSLLKQGGTLEAEVGWPLSADFIEAAFISSSTDGGVNKDEAEIQRLHSEINEVRLESQQLLSELKQLRASAEGLQQRHDEVLRSLSWRVTRPLRGGARLVRSLYRKAREVLRQSLKPSLLYEMRPPEAALGFFEMPQPNSRVEKTLSVSGWLFFKQAKIKAVWMTVDDSITAPLAYGHVREDVAQAYPSFTAARTSGFSGMCSVNDIGRKRAVVAIWAELEGGVQVKCLARRVTIRPPFDIAQLAVVIQLAVAVSRRFWRAFRHRRLPLAPSRWLNALRHERELMLVRKQAPHGSNGALSLVRMYVDPYQQWIELNRLSEKLLNRMRSDALRVAARGPTISVVVPVFNTPADFLRDMIESVMAQIYPKWELCLADDVSTEPHVRELLEQAQRRDIRVKVVFRQQNGHIVEATNSALDIASGDYIAFLDHDDMLSQDALLHVAECITDGGDVDWIYTDEDKIDRDGRRCDPQFKGPWNPEMAITHNYTHHLAVIRKSVVLRAGRLRTGFEGAQDLDLFLRVAELTVAERIRHVPHICYHWRAHAESTASSGAQKSYVFTSAERAIREALVRRGLPAEPILPPLASERGLCLYQLKWREPASASKLVTIVIPTRDRVDLLKRCITSLQKTVNADMVSLIIVDDRSSKPQSREYFEKLQCEAVLSCRIVSNTAQDDRFNYARLVNSALPYVTTPYVLHLNNDIEAIERGWLEDMIGWMSISEVGVVGARLLYPDRTIQHAGVMVGPHGGLADHQFHKQPANEVGYLALAHAARNVTAVTGACLLTRTELYKKLGGFDEKHFGVEYNDVDFCMRVVEQGMRVVYSPQATLIHLSSASRGRDYNPYEHINFVRKYPNLRDRYISENVSIDSTLMAVDPSRFNHAARVNGLNVLVISHDLHLAGAPIVAYEFARHFVINGCRATLLSLEDGPLRERYEELRIPVRIAERFPAMHRTSLSDLRDYLRRLGSDLNLRDFDLVVCNTLTAFWGIELARLLGLPSIWHIHESTSTTVYGVHIERSSRSLLRSAFVNANRIVFQAEATRRLFHDVYARDNFITIPGGIPIDRIDAFRAAHTKAQLRDKYGIERDALVVTLPGTICERKGQHVFLDAIKRLSAVAVENGLDSKVVFVMVGARPSAYLNLIRDRIAELQLEQHVRLFDETKDIYDFYVLSDIFVCASFVESFPMVVLLAMAFQLPIVTTDVFGIPEIVSDGHDALCVKPGDAAALANAIEVFLKDRDQASMFAARARAKAARLFASDRLLARHLMLAKQVALEECPSVQEQPASEPTSRACA